jgi:hypothetical protein
MAWAEVMDPKLTTCPVNHFQTSILLHLHISVCTWTESVVVHLVVVDSMPS